MSTVSAPQHIAILGGGIIGLSLALECADAGFRVTVLERGRAMEQASWAAAGMLAVDDPENPPALLPLSRLSRSLYPAFLSRVEALSRQAVPLRTTQTLQGIAASSEVQPTLLAGLRTERFHWSVLEEASLDPRDLCAALPVAAVRAGVGLREHSSAERMTEAGGEVQLELAGGERLTADHCVVASGAWAGQQHLPVGEWRDEQLSVVPRKGQMIEVTLAGPTLPMVVRTPELYLVPRGDGRVAVGATVEHAGFDRTVDAGAGDALWQAAAELWPPILEGRITARWTGLRPGVFLGAHDGLPLLGRLRHGSRLWAATGHFRNGILLAPATARVMRELFAGESLSVPLDCFSPERASLSPA